jgi:hypothetical protein
MYSPALAASIALMLMLSAGMFKRQLRWKPPKPRRVRVRVRRNHSES